VLELAADEGFNSGAVRQLWHREPALDLVRVQEVDLSSADDGAVLEWAAGGAAPGAAPAGAA
jgi:hypothetical protein